MTPPNRYASTFISGFAEIVEKQLKKQYTDSEIELLLESFIVYKTAATLDVIKKIPYLNNTFILLQQTKVKKEDTTAAIVKRLFNETEGTTITKYFNLNKQTTFRIFISRENQLVSINTEIIGKIEKKILVQSDRLSVDRQKADYEFWFMIRSEGKAFFGVRITHVGDQKKKEYQPGELKKELAYLLCLFSDPEESDVFIDPFSGSGAIPVERAHISPYKKIIAADIDENLVFKLKRKMRELKNTEVYQLDALHLFPLSDESVDKIVTDPPWGLYKKTDNDLDLFYKQTIDELYRVLKNNGVMIILSARNDNLEKAIALLKGKLKILTKLDILVSGKKATVYKVIKTV